MVNEKVVDKLDHQLINDLIQLPSAENIAIWIWNQLVDLKSNIKEQLNDPNLPQSVTKYFQDPSDSTLAVPDFSSQIRLAEVKLWETPTSFVTYAGN